MTSKAFYTIVSCSYLNQAITASKSFKNHNKDFDVYIFIIDLKEDLIINDESFTIHSINELKNQFPEIINFNSYYNIIETVCALKPYVAKFLLTNYDIVIYGDSDTYYYNLLDLDMIDSTKGNFTPHRLIPSTKENSFSDEFDNSLMKYGFFNLGFFLLTKNDLIFLNWWIRKVTFECLYAPEQFLFVDQKWIDLAVNYFDLNILQDYSINVGPWNLDERNITKSNNSYFVNNIPLKMVHFSGINNLNSQSHISNYYSTHLTGNSSLKNSIILFKELGNFWLQKQNQINISYNELISKVNLIEKISFNNSGFFKKNRLINKIKSNKSLSKDGLLFMAIDKIDFAFSKFDSYRFGRVHLISDLKKIKSLINRFKP